MWQADIVELAIGEIGAEMTQIAAPLADKQFQAALGGVGIGRVLAEAAHAEGCILGRSDRSAGAEGGCSRR